MAPPDPLDDTAGIAALAEPVRRDLYRFVTRARDAVSREQAATGVSLPAHTVKFHLDRLVDEGLLDVEYRRLGGRTGPGAGRPSKLYRRADRELAVSVPERQYDLLSRILANAVSEASQSGSPVREVASRFAHAEGVRLGDASAHNDAADDLDRLAAVLDRSGFEPWVEGDSPERTLRLANCPFHQVAQVQTELVCGLNLDLVRGVVDGLGCTAVMAALDPGPGRCCVSARSVD